MSLRRSPADPQLSAKTSSFTCSQMTVTTLAPGLTTTCAESSNETLDIEDLDLANLEISPSTLRTGSPMQTEALVEEHALFSDFDANDFFGEELPAVVSEACMMNDLYILVKIPGNNTRNHIPLMTTATQTSPLHSPNSCLSSNRVIFPIQEEEDEHSEPEPRSRIPVRMKTRSRRTCWGKESVYSEEFISKTNIVRQNELILLPNQVPDQSDQIGENPIIPETTSSSCQNQIELEEINLNSNQLASQVVSLENYGILITPTKAPKTENLLVFQVDTDQRGNDKNEKSSCFRWLTKFFRPKRRRNGCVQAKVYKTYFVKWKKCSEEDECARCQTRPVKTCRRNSA